MKFRRAGWACSALLSLATAPAVAGSFSVSPTRIELAAGQRTAVVSLRNADSTPLTVQASLVEWAQPDGEDVYTPTRDLLSTPPVFTVPPNGEQIVRIALRGAHDPARELAYRIFFQEVPQAGAGSANRLNISLRVGVPIFLLAPQPEPAPQLAWNAEVAADGTVSVSATNGGNTHVQVTGFNLFYGGDAASSPVSAVKYVLPGKRVSWSVTPPAGTNLQQLRVDGHSDRGDFAADVVAAAAR